MDNITPHNQYKILGYEITNDKDYLNSYFGITPEINRLIEKIAYNLVHGETISIKRLTNLCLKYPNIPHFKNYLSTAYNDSGNSNKAIEVNHWLIKEHSDYLFGKLNLAAEYYEMENNIMLYLIADELRSGRFSIGDLFIFRFLIGWLTGFGGAIGT